MARAKNGNKASLLDALLDEATWLITHADSLKIHRRDQEARVEWLRAADCEQRAACLLEAEGNLLEAAVHRVSAASCFALADSFTEAVTLARSALSAPIRQDFRNEIESYLTDWLRKAKKQLNKKLRKPTAVVS